MISPLVIQITNFALYGASSCVLQYASIYLLHYSGANSSDVGRIMLISSVFGMMLSLTICSLADRYQAYRSLYLLSLSMAFISYTALLVPIRFGGAVKVVEQETDVVLTDLSPPENDPTNPQTLETTADSTTTTQYTSSDLRDASQSAVSASWFYYSAVCVIVGAMSTTISMSLCDSFGASLAPKCNKSFGSIRLWGAIGWVVVSMALSYLNDIKCLVFLEPALILYGCLTATNIVIVAFWPDSRPFDLSDSSTDTPLEPKGTQFTFRRKFFPDRAAMADAQNDLDFVEILKRNRKSSLSCVTITGASLSTTFDTKDDNMFRNIRRCSLAPLGDSFMIKQFELDEQSGKHFNHVTKVEPLSLAKSNGSADEMQPRVEYTVDSYASRRLSSKTIEVGELVDRFNQANKAAESDGVINVWLHLRILRMLAARNKLMVRFFVLYMICGFSMSMNWSYLFPYLDELDPLKFPSLSAKVMVCCYLSETVFYHYSSYFIKLCGYSGGMTAILFLYSIRYLLYLALMIPQLSVPLETILAIELALALNMSWLDCVLNESALRFALEARECVPELVDLGYIDGSQRTADRVTNGFKATMVAVSSCCFDGFGIGLGALTGGWLIQHSGFHTLWLATALLAFLAGVSNGLFDLEHWLTRSKTSQRH